MAFTADDLALITDAIKGGERSVRYADGRMVTYQDSDAMMRVRDAMIAEIAAAAAPARGRVFRLHQSGSGLV